MCERGGRPSGEGKAVSEGKGGRAGAETPPYRPAAGSPWMNPFIPPGPHPPPAPSRSDGFAGLHAREEVGVEPGVYTSQVFSG